MIEGFLFGLGLIAALIFVANIELVIIGAVCLAALAVLAVVCLIVGSTASAVIIAGVIAILVFWKHFAPRVLAYDPSLMPWWHPWAAWGGIVGFLVLLFVGAWIHDLASASADPYAKYLTRHRTHGKTTQ